MKRKNMSSSIVTRRAAALGVLGTGSAVALAACSVSSPASNSDGGSASSSSSEPAKDYTGEVKFDSYDTSAGEYVPATRTEPAKNVPVPKLPENANEKTVEAFYAHIGYYAACMQYVLTTGDDGPFLKGSFPQEETQGLYRDPEMKELLPMIKSGERWFDNPTVTYTLNTSQPDISGDRYKWVVNIKNDLGAFVASPDGVADIPSQDRTTTDSATFRGTYSDGKWTIVSTD